MCDQFGGTVSHTERTTDAEQSSIEERERVAQKSFDIYDKTRKKKASIMHLSPY
jgi:hypothetical protein